MPQAQAEATTSFIDEPDSTTSDSNPTSAAAEFSQVVARYETPLLRYVAWLADPADAEDLVQETFMRLHRELQKPGARIERVGAFLFKASHNLALDSLRRRRARDDAKRRATDEAQATHKTSRGPLQGMVARAAAQKAMDELAQLPGDERRIVFLKIVQGFSLREIAEIMGMAFSSVAYKLSSGLGIMARRLEDAGVV